MEIKDRLLIALVIAIWGVNFLFMRLSLNEMPPMILGALRFVCVVFPAIFFLKKPDVAWKWLILYGLTISFGQFALMFTALHWGFPTGLAALVLQIQVFFTVILAAILWREPVLLHQFIGMITTFIGLILIGLGQYQGNLPLHALLPVVGAAASWACGNIIVKKIGKVNPLSLVVWGSVSALVAFSLVSLAMYPIDEIGNFITQSSWKAWAGVLFLAYVSNLVGYTGWGALLSRYPAGKVTPFAFLVPVIALLVGYVILSERLGMWHILGILGVMSGLLLHIFGQTLFSHKR
ncbi:MAG: EamA family transporter [Alysiella sp.]|uniref:EamA family transporter n=1 Tax=Alysiella sp. TaxID=1872483 RepID=UPI0026DA93CE|nr:EamA family transporter [Alysiella sp.]MDO4433451.1 EamA family transporter [Alysiella sp.]